MSRNSALPAFFLALAFCLAVIFVCASPMWAQSATTGALTGTVTDPSNGVVVGAMVIADNRATGQGRTTTTDASGVYKFSLLPPGEYSVKVSASGFKTAQVGSVTVNVTETAVLNQKLEIGATSAEVTVEGTRETIQTQNATVGNLVGSETVTTLPLNSRNYTQIIDLSPGVGANVASAAAVGNGTQDINVNGNGSNQNNYMMDGATLTNYGSGGGAQSGSFPGIGIPNADAIQEFKIQTSQYDAEYGRNPGASVNVVTKSGTNNFHGAAWEFFRNSVLDGNDFFNKFSEKQLGTSNKPQILNENLFGGTIGGPIKKDKLFFFGSYQGIRQKNGIGTNGFATGLSTGLTLLPFSEPDGTRNDEVGTIPMNYITGNTPCNYATYRGYLGCYFAGASGFLDGVTIHPPDQANPLNDATTNINNVAVNFLRTPGPNKGLNAGFWFPSVPFRGGLPLENCWTDRSCATNVVSDPILANEDQYLANIDYVINEKNTFSEKFFTSQDPQVQPFTCLGGGCTPGAPTAVKYTSYSGTLKLTTVVTNNFVNEAFFSFQRQTSVGATQDYVGACSVAGFVQPLTSPIVNPAGCAGLNGKNINPSQTEIPTIGTIALFGLPNEGVWNNGGNFIPANTTYFNYFQGNEQISWNAGKHSIRAGFWVNRIQYNWTIPGRGALLFWNTAAFLTSSSGAPVTGTPPALNGIVVNFYGLTNTDGNKHNQRVNEFASFVEDDIKLNRKLTLNLGLRWEYDGYPTEVHGLFTNAWPTATALVNTGSSFLGNEIVTGPPCSVPSAFPFPPCPNATSNNQIGTLAGYAVQSNYNPNIQKCGNPLAPSACGLSAPAGIFPGYPGGATGVLLNNNKSIVHGAPYTNFGPRIGVAWQPLNDKFVIRAGYGIFYDAVYANLLSYNQAGNPPYNGSVAQTPLNSTDNPVAILGLMGWQPRTLQVVAGNPSTGATLIQDNNGGLGVGATSDSEFLGVPLIQQYNLDLQYSLAHNWVADIGYVGSHGTQLYNWSQPINVSFLAPNAPNEPTDAVNKRMIIGSGAQGTPAAFPFNDSNNTNPATQILANTGNSMFDGNVIGRVSNLGYGANGMASTNTHGDSLYNSLQAQLRHQFSNGLLLQVSYTWSKLITNINASQAGGAGIGIAAPGNVLSGSSGSNDPLDLRQQYGLAAFNRPQRVIIAYSYDLPYRHMEGFAGHVLGGWAVSGITTIQNGLPFSVTDTNAGTIYWGVGGTAFCTGCNIRAELAPPNTGRCRADGVCNSVGVATTGSNFARVVSGLGGGNGWINHAAFTPAPCIGGTVPGNCAGSGRRYGLRELGRWNYHGAWPAQLGYFRDQAHQNHGSAEYGIPGRVLQRVEPCSVQPTL